MFQTRSISVENLDPIAFKDKINVSVANINLPEYWLQR